MESVLAGMRAELERCSEESCVAALANVADREAGVRRAQEYAENGEWAAFGLSGGGNESRHFNQQLRLRCPFVG